MKKYCCNCKYWNTLPCEIGLFTASCTKYETESSPISPVSVKRCLEPYIDNKSNSCASWEPDVMYRITRLAIRLLVRPR